MPEGFECLYYYFVRLFMDLISDRRRHSSHQKGPSGLLKGPSALHKGPFNLKKGPSSRKKGSSNRKKGPSNCKKGPSNCKKGSSSRKNRYSIVTKKSGTLYPAFSFMNLKDYL